MQCETKRPSSTQRGYGYRWQQYTALRLREYPLCEGLKLKPDGLIVVNTHPGIVRAAKLTDHIIPHKGDEILMWAEWNHQSACDDCHNVKTSQYDGGFGNKGNGINARGRG
jgi:5-methylcytosine-specific restriction protein A